MESRSNEIEKCAMRLKRTASFPGSETENAGDNRAVNSPSAMSSKIIAVPIKRTNDNVDGHSAETCCDMPSSTLGEEDSLTLDSLHTSILVQVICNVSHDDLESLSTVSHNFEEAVNVARQIHFDFKTPVRVKGPKRMANSFLLNAPKKSASFRMSRLSAQEIKELQNCSQRTRKMIDDL